MSGVLVNQRWLQVFQYPDAVMKGFVVAIFELGALVTSVVAGWAIDHFGRVGTIRIGAFVFIVGLYVADSCQSYCHVTGWSIGCWFWCWLFQHCHSNLFCRAWTC